MQGAKRSDAHRHREHLQRRSAPAAGEPNVQVIPERVLKSPRSQRHAQHLLVRQLKLHEPRGQADEDLVDHLALRLRQAADRLGLSDKARCSMKATAQ